MFGLASIALFILVAAHVVHLPALAHEVGVRVTEPTRVGAEDGNLAVHAVDHGAIGHAHGTGASLPDRGSNKSHLTDQGDDDLECMATAATIPMQSATLVALALPAYIPDASEAGSLGAAALDIHPPEPARRHLLLQVFLR
jgi:hypothetical protein